jgi:alpha-beta hydrolase superfamily lysophospholipase
VARVLGLALVFLVVVGAGLWFLGPRTAVDTAGRFDAGLLPADLDGWLAGREAVFSDITPGTAKRIVWAGAAGVRTPLAIVNLHGFSATAEEIRPVPDEVAQALGANLYFARLAGHGRGGEALAAVTAEDWVTDLDEALAIGRRIGERVIVVGTSTGGTLAILAAADPARAEAVAGLVLVSPNLRLANGTAQAILDAPWVESWGAAVAGPTRSFTPQNEDHGRFWTTSYPTRALYPMGALMRAVRALDPATLRVPMLLIQAPGDKVVSAAASAMLADAWGGPVTRVAPVLTAADDPYAHVIAGRILSPGQTAATVQAITDWAKGL